MLTAPWLKRIDLLTGEKTSHALSTTAPFVTATLGDGSQDFIGFDGENAWLLHSRGGRRWLMHGTTTSSGAADFVFMEFPEARHPELEAALGSGPGAVAVYADWLEEQGDPYAGVLNPALLAARGPAGLWFLEGFERTQQVVATLRHGLVHELELRSLPEEDFLSTLHRLCHLRACVALERLRIDARRQVHRELRWERLLRGRMWTQCRWPRSLRELVFVVDARRGPPEPLLSRFQTDLATHHPQLAVLLEGAAR